MIGWIDASSGASGDMLLGALVDAGADEQVMQAAIAAVAPQAVGLSIARVRRHGISASLAHVEVADSSTQRSLADIVKLITGARLNPQISRHSIDVFSRLGAAEAAAHGVTVDEVHFHEVGALDAIVDIVGACAGFVSLGLTELHCSPVAVGSGSVGTDHGELSVPPPAVAALLQGAPTYAGTAATELCTPTGAALLSHWVTQFGPQPLMAVAAIGTGAGTKDFDSHANVVRLFVGEPHTESLRGAVVYETNVDDLDPRLWPAVVERLFDAGASDAWLTPIVMKKGRPAHTLSVLMPVERASDVRQVIFAETSAIGLREMFVGKHVLDRSFAQVLVEGQKISVKVARAPSGNVLNVQPEFDDVASAARILDRPVKDVLAAAVAASSHLWERHDNWS
ncbi:MAG: nickel pincer cofactor biosynthesis protein LarC [Nocardioidaceae bacterium]|nr:nickel pincer cofactor biosynthesis protein LarC [Nocardioidaceae bacterium]